MAKPSQLPRWADGAGAVTTPEPTEQKKSDGWQTSERPPRQYFNWWMNRVYKWCQYLDNLTNEVLTWAARHTFNGGITVPTPTAATDAATKQYVDDHVTDAAGAHAASAIANTPAGNLAATTVQAALNELDTEKAALAGASFTGAVSVPTPTAAAHAARRDMAGQDGMVTRAKLAAVGQQVSGSSGSFITSSTTLVDVTNLSVTLTTTGRPVMILVQSDGDQYYPSLIANSPAHLYIAILRDATIISRQNVYIVSGGISAGLNIVCLDTPSAGTYTYKVQAASSSGASVEVSRYKLIAYEL